MEAPNNEITEETIKILKETIRAVKIRIAFIGHPNEPMNSAGTDWSKECKLLDKADKALVECKLYPCTCGSHPIINVGNFVVCCNNKCADYNKPYTCEAWKEEHKPRPVERKEGDEIQFGDEKRILGPKVAQGCHVALTKPIKEKEKPIPCKYCLTLLQIYKGKIVCPKCSQPLEK